MNQHRTADSAESRFRFILATASCPTAELLPLARHAEVCGFDVVAVSDHLVVPERTHSVYPYNRHGLAPFGPDDDWSDPWVSIAAMAAVTERLRFMTNVFILPLRDPFSVAKAVGTAAVLSGDRVSLGIGVGWMRDEFDLLGRTFADRGRRTDEMIELLRLLWSGQPVDFVGRHYRTEHVRMAPVPASPVPVLVGGESPAALQRAAALGDGYISVAHRSETLIELSADLAGRRATSGRADEPFDLFCVVTDATTVDDHVRLATKGITGRITLPWGYASQSSVPLDDKIASMSRFAESVIGPVRQKLPA